MMNPDEEKHRQQEQQRQRELENARELERQRRSINEREEQVNASRRHVNPRAKDDGKPPPDND